MPDFHMEELVAYVQARVADIAPGSPCRIQRDMRARGELNYKVVSRKNSHYRVLPQATNPALEAHLWLRYQVDSHKSQGGMVPVAVERTLMWLEELSDG